MKEKWSFGHRVWWSYTAHSIENVSDQINNDEKTTKDLFDYLLECIYYFKLSRTEVMHLLHYLMQFFSSLIYSDL